MQGNAAHALRNDARVLIAIYTLHDKIDMTFIWPICASVAMRCVMKTLAKEMDVLNAFILLVFEIFCTLAEMYRIFPCVSDEYIRG